MLQPQGESMPRSLAVLLSCGLLLLGSLAFGSTAGAADIGSTTTCTNGVPDTAGLGVICEVTIVNTITPTGGSAVVTVRECHGAANDAEADCSASEAGVLLAEPVSEVNQCNNSLNGGGATMECSVDITNNFVGVDPTPVNDATVNQCNGSGAGPGGDITTGCDPFPANTTNATITQCNGSANGLTLVEMTCTASGTASDAFAVTVNQCNDSVNGGGALLICSANIENNVVAGVTPTPTATPPSGGGATPRPPGATPPATDTGVSPAADGSGPAAALAALFLVLVSALVVSRRPLRGIRSR
jgi:hypothetical protein